MDMLRLLARIAALLLLAHDVCAADNLAPPSVPSDLAVPAGHELYLSGHAIGTQDYICLPSGQGIAWSLFTPQATLFTADRRPAMTHYFSPNPAESGAVRATWQDSKDASAVWGRVAKTSSDPAFVQAGAIAWLLIEVAGAREAPGGGGSLAPARFVQRINTTGGAAPAAGCASAEDIGKKSFVPYTADYLFYRRGPA